MKLAKTARKVPIIRPVSISAKRTLQGRVDLEKYKTQFESRWNYRFDSLSESEASLDEASALCGSWMVPSFIKS